MRCLVLVALAACGSKSEPSAPPPTEPPARAPARPPIAEAPGPGPWMKLTDGGGLLLTSPGRWECASIDADGTRNNVSIKRSTCTVPITDLDRVACPDYIPDTKVSYDDAGHLTNAGTQFTWLGDTLATRDDKEVTIQRTPELMELRYGGYTTIVDTDTQGRVTRIRTWIAQARGRTPDTATVFAYAGDELVSAVHQAYRLPDTILWQTDLISCATAASPRARTRAPVPKGPLGLATDKQCLELAPRVAAFDLPAGTAEERAKQASEITVACRAWAPAMRRCVTRAKTDAERDACPLDLAPVGPPRPCEVIADHEVALAAVALKGRLTVEDAAARRALVLGDCTSDAWGDSWNDAQRGCTAAATTHAMFLECLR